MLLVICGKSSRKLTKADFALHFVWLLSGCEDALRRSATAKLLDSLKCPSTWLS